MELIEFASAEAFLEPARLCLEREEAWRSLGLALRLKEEAQPVRDGEPQSGSLGSVRGSGRLWADHPRRCSNCPAAARRFPHPPG